MNKARTIARHEFTQTIRRKAFILTTMGLPLIALLGTFINDVVQNIDSGPDTPEHQQIGYVDGTGLFAGFTEEPNLTFVSFAGEAGAKEALLAGEIEEYFVIPETYVETGIVTRYTTERELEPPLQTLVEIRDFLLNNLLASTVSDDLLERTKYPLVLSSWYLNESGEVSEPPDPLAAILAPYIFGLLFIMSIFFTSGYLMQSVSEEKENRIMEVLLSSVSARQLLLGKIVGLGAAGLIQIGIWFITIRVFLDVGAVNMSVLEDVHFPTGMLLLGVVYFILGYGLFAVLYAGLGSVATTARESQQMAGIFVMPAVSPLILMNIIGEHPNGGVAQALTFIPITAPTATLMRLPNTNVPPWELVLSLTLLAASIALGLWVVSKIFRAYLLMYGKRPGIREIWHSVRQA